MKQVGNKLGTLWFHLESYSDLYYWVLSPLLATAGYCWLLLLVFLDWSDLRAGITWDVAILDAHIVETDCNAWNIHWKKCLAVKKSTVVCWVSTSLPLGCWCGGLGGVDSCRPITRLADAPANAIRDRSCTESHPSSVLSVWMRAIQPTFKCVLVRWDEMRWNEMMINK